MPCQVNPELTSSGSPSSEHYQLVFLASLPPLGLLQFHLLPGQQLCTLSSLITIHYSLQHSLVVGGAGGVVNTLSLSHSRVFPVGPEVGSSEISLSTSYLTASFSRDSGLLHSITTSSREVYTHTFLSVEI